MIERFPVRSKLHKPKCSREEKPSFNKHAGSLVACSGRVGVQANLAARRNWAGAQRGVDTTMARFRAVVGHTLSDSSAVAEVEWDRRRPGRVEHAFSSPPNWSRRLFVKHRVSTRPKTSFSVEAMDRRLILITSGNRCSIPRWTEQGPSAGFARMVFTSSATIPTSEQASYGRKRTPRADS